MTEVFRWTFTITSTVLDCYLEQSLENTGPRKEMGLLSLSPKAFCLAPNTELSRSTMASLL